MPFILKLILPLLLLSSCYQQDARTSDAWSLTEQQMDSISFYTTHHYTRNYNFLVKTDSLFLIAQHPTEYVNSLPVDSLTVLKHDRIVVADITTMPTDSVDSVWVKVARDQQTIGWLHESVLLASTSPDAPISQFIDFFSNTHHLLFLAVFTLALAFFVLRKLMRLGVKMVHFNDISSFYPAVLCFNVAMSAVFYSTIQMVAPESWRHYYYHPTLNPFSVPLHLGLFLLSVWFIIIVAIAAVDDIRRQITQPGEAFFYYLGLIAVCAFNYVFFSISTLYYIGYPLLAVYFIMALRQYLRAHTLYICGNCGQALRHKGQCPHCGAMNT